MSSGLKSGSDGQVLRGVGVVEFRQRDSEVQVALEDIRLSFDRVAIGVRGILRFVLRGVDVAEIEPRTVVFRVFSRGVFQERFGLRPALLIERGFGLIDRRSFGGLGLARLRGAYGC